MCPLKPGADPYFINLSTASRLPFAVVIISAAPIPACVGPRIVAIVLYSRGRHPPDASISPIPNTVEAIPLTNLPEPEVYYTFEVALFSSLFKTLFGASISFLISN
jgi:hypothetical protein